MLKSSRRRKIREKPYSCPGRDNTSEIEEDYSDTLSLIQAKSISLFPKMTPEDTSVVLATSTIKMTSLVELISIKDEAIPSTFWENMSFIFQYSKTDVAETLEKLDINALKALREFLLVKLVVSLPDYVDKPAIKRKVKNTIIQDIYHLGFSIANNSPDKELDIIFNNKNDPSEPQTPDIAQITDLSQVIILVTNLKAELDTYKLEKAELEEKVRLITECCSIHISDSQVAPKVVDLVTNDNMGATIDPQIFVPQATISATVAKSAPGPSNLPVTNRLLPGTIRDQRGSSSSIYSTDTDSRHQYRSIPKRRPGNHRNTNNLTKAKPIKTAVKKIHFFIGNVDESNTIQDIQFHLQDYGVKVELADIKEIPIKSNNKAFKILISADMAETVKSIWPKDVKAEPFREASQRGVSHIKPGGRGNDNNKQRQNPRKQMSFRKPPYQRNMLNDREYYPHDYPHDYYNYQRSWNSQPEHYYRKPYYMY